MTKDTKIVIRCDQDQKWRWERFAGPYENNADALQHLLDAYEDDADKLKKPAF